MTSKSLRNLLCALAASATWAFVTPAHAIAYSVGFDPDLFTGGITIDVDVSCLPDVAGSVACKPASQKPGDSAFSLLHFLHDNVARFEAPDARLN